MTKYLLIISVLIISRDYVNAQSSCFTGGVMITSQSEIDNFSIDNSGCTIIDGDMTIAESVVGDIINLNGLNVITRINGFLKIESNTHLTSFNGLENISRNDGYIFIDNNSSLTSIEGIQGLSPSRIESSDPLVKDLEIKNNTSLSNCAVMSICRLLNDQGKTVLIQNNGLGCDNNQAVFDACNVSYPPVNGQFELRKNANNDLIVFTNSHGGVIQGNGGNTYYGDSSGMNSAATGIYYNAANSTFGYNAGRHMETAIGNTFIGNYSGYDNVSGFGDTFVGSSAGRANTGGGRNSFFGRHSGRNNIGGRRNTFLGAYSGSQSENASDCVFVGYQAGMNELNSDRLYIHNNSSSQPLIFGNFDENRAGINWDSSASLPATLSINGTLYIEETAKLKPLTVAPSCAASDEGLLYFDGLIKKLRVCNGVSWVDLH